MRADELEQLLLALAAFLSDLGESCGDHAERADPGLERGPRSVEHVGAGQADDCEVDLLGQLLDRRVAPDAGHRLSRAVDRVRGSLELAGEDVPEDDASDRLAPRRRSDHRQARRREERAQRGDDREVIALLDVAAIGVRRLDRERDLEGSVVEGARDAEPCVLEDPHHRRVLAHHLCDEVLDSDRGRALGELLEHACADPASLLVVGDGERHLRRRRVA